MFNASNSQGARNNSKMSDHLVCDVNYDMGLHSVSDFYAMSRYGFTRVTI